MSQWLKAEFCIKSVGIPRRQQKPPQTLQVRMLNDGAHEQLRDTATAMLRDDKNICHMGDDGEIGNNSGKAGLSPVEKRAKAKGVLDGPLDDSPRNALRPNRMSAKNRELTQRPDGCGRWKSRNYQVFS